MLELGGDRPWRPPVIETVATENRGIDELFDAIVQHRAFLESDGRLEDKRAVRVRDEIQSILEARLTTQVGELCAGDAFDRLVERVVARSLDPYAAVEKLVAG
jgi:LAO/AO transport system kinase